MLSMSESQTRVKYRNSPSQEAEGNQTEKRGEVFEITDFTTASDWERIIARFEDVIHDFKLPRFVPETTIPKDAFSKWKWTSTGTDITDVPDFEFLIKRIRLRETIDAVDDREALETARNPSQPKHISKTCFSADAFPAVLEQMLSTDNDFPFSTDVPPLARWFGITDFLVISPSAFNSLDQNVSESRLKLILSSICIAVSNAKCPIPVFLQFDDPSRNLFAGISESFGYRTSYDIIDLERVSDRLQTLSGVVDIFKEKIGVTSDTNLIKASIRLTLKLNPDHVDSDALSDEEEFLQKSFSLGSLPFGSLEYEGFLVHLFASWPNANAEAVEDTLTHSDLDPLQAPLWSAQLLLNEKATYSLTEAMKNFAKQMNRKETVKSLLEYLDPEAMVYDEKDQAAQALKRLTGDKEVPLRSRLSKAFYSRLPKYHFPVPIDSESMNEILAYLFPDSDLAKDFQRKFPSVEEIDDPILRSLKAAPANSLTCRLSLALWYVYETFNGALASAYLWQEVLLEFRYRWENCYVIPGVDEGAPNFATCIFNQKLQMLNCCINKRRTPGSNAKDEKPSLPSKSNSSEFFDADAAELSEDDDEFFDCEEDVAAIPDNKSKKPEGRLHQLHNLSLLRDPEIPLYVPVTQEPAPMTEDAVSEHLELLAATEDTDAGRVQRAKLQSAALVSDIAAFKAANPGCIFEDFVRWHSPRDWEETDAENGGQLSERMGLPGSAWLDAWDNTEPKAVRRQKRLFDERVEAEKVLSFLNMTLGDIFKNLLPVFVKAGLTKLCEEMRTTELKCPNDKTDLFRAASRLFSSPMFSYVEFEKLLRSARLNEQIICCYRKLQEITAKAEIGNDGTFTGFLRNLTETRELINIPGGARSPIGQNLAAVFDQTKPSKSSLESDFNKKMVRRKLPPSTTKEFILRTVAPRPFSISRPGVHRMYVCLKTNEVRIAGAFTEDLLNG